MAYSLPQFGKLGQAALRPTVLGTVDVFQAPKGTEYNHPTAWVYLGRIYAGSFKNDFTRKFFDVVTGIPETTKESFVTEIEAKVEFELMEPTTMAYLLASGNGTRICGYGASTTVKAATTECTIEDVEVTSATGFAVGDEIEVANAAGTTKEYSFITQIDGDVFRVFPRLTRAPIPTDTVKRVTMNNLAAGESDVEKVAIRAIAYNTDGTQIVTHIKEARVSSGLKDDHKDKALTTLPISLDCFAVYDSNLAGYYVAKKYILTPELALAYSEDGWDTQADWATWTHTNTSSDVTAGQLTLAAGQLSGNAVSPLRPNRTNTANKSVESTTNLPGGTTITIEHRTSADGVSFSAWNATITAVANAQYIQHRISMTRPAAEAVGVDRLVIRPV